MSENINNNSNENTENNESVENIENAVESTAENEQNLSDEIVETVGIEPVEVQNEAEIETEPEQTETGTEENVDNIEPEPVVITENMAIAENISAQIEKNNLSKNGQAAFKDSVFGTSAILGILTVITVLAISVLNSLTAPVIDKRLADEKDKWIEYFFGYNVYAETAEEFEMPAPVTEVLIIREEKTLEKNIIGYCVTVAPKGFADKIIMLVAVDADMTVRDTQILSMSETAGYGTKIDDEKESWFREQFISRTQNIKDIRTEPLPGENSIRIIAGATVSSKAFLNGVNSALDAVGNLVNQTEIEPEEEVNGDG